MKTNSKNSMKTMLTREQLKNVTGGSSLAPTTCLFFCCPISCSESHASGFANCTSNEQCQDWGRDIGMTCEPGNYLAALCV